jgi:hypothetical protein
MNRQDAQLTKPAIHQPVATPILPASPHPTPRLPSPVPIPAHTTPSPPHHSPPEEPLTPTTPRQSTSTQSHRTHAPIPMLGAPISPDPYSSPNAHTHEWTGSTSANTNTHTHEWSGSTAQTSEDDTSHELITPQRSNSGRRKPVPPLPAGVDGYSEDILVPRPRSYDQENLRRSGEIHSPRPQRDTIHNIVDQYSHEDEEEGEGGGTRISILSASTASFGNEEVGKISGERERGREEVDLSPPKPVFDLTPGREPSPARYKHGEPLHFG